MKNFGSKVFVFRNDIIGALFFTLVNKEVVDFSCFDGQELNNLRFFSLMLKLLWCPLRRLVYFKIVKRACFGSSVHTFSRVFDYMETEVW